MDTTDVDIVAEQADMLQVGARNMQNFSLLKALGKIRKPVLLKRGLAAKVEDLLLAAEYLLAAGNEQVILCERGIRTFETATRNTLDLNAVAVHEAEDPFAGDRRPIARHWRARPCRPDVTCSGCMRRGRTSDRGSHEPGRRLVRRRPVALSASVRNLDGDATANPRRRRTGLGMNALATSFSSAAARSVTRRLPGPVDLRSLYARISATGRVDTALLETTQGRNIILDRAAAVRIECRAGEVIVDALSLGRRPAGTPAASGPHLSNHLLSRTDQKLILKFQRSAAKRTQKSGSLGASPFDVLRAIMSGFHSETPQEPMTICLLGVVAFDHVDLFEQLPTNAQDPTAFPDFIFWLAESAVISEPRLTPRLVCTAFAIRGNDEQLRRSFNSAVERLQDLSFRASDVPPLHPRPGAAVEISVDLDDAEFASAVTRLKEHILAGDVYQVVGSRTFSVPRVRTPLSSFAPHSGHSIAVPTCFSYPWRTARCSGRPRKLRCE